MNRLTDFFARFVLALSFVFGVSSVSAQSSDAAFEKEVLRLTNLARQRAGKTPLVINTLLSKAAREHSRAMAVDKFFSHSNPKTGSTPSSRVRAAGYNSRATGENIAYGTRLSPKQVVDMWMKSSGHRQNILGELASFTQIGIGHIQYGQNHYYTQVFAIPASGDSGGGSGGGGSTTRVKFEAFVSGLSGRVSFSVNGYALSTNQNGEVSEFTNNRGQLTPVYARLNQGFVVNLTKSPKGQRCSVSPKQGKVKKGRDVTIRCQNIPSPKRYLFSTGFEVGE